MDMPVNGHDNYHAHFYFDESSRVHAQASMKNWVCMSVISIPNQ
ncbi:hypothetical protein MOVI109754_04605 [Moritella viscosa]|uniref:Uncharacterized protein n=1 Tax=Moritella viscosa TaxID=80854 RepID=A0ABY1H917_9GAMM|nr:Putative uncharacterized protein [Moritella viscosa]SGY89757.1 Putative uncharacterized protein [Moritella viscosa]SHO24922.1 Putative uncharacterized protein [Moritella viscosa]